MRCHQRCHRAPGNEALHVLADNGLASVGVVHALVKIGTGAEREFSDSVGGVTTWRIRLTHFVLLVSAQSDVMAERERRVLFRPMANELRVRDRFGSLYQRDHLDAVQWIGIDQHLVGDDSPHIKTLRDVMQRVAARDVINAVSFAAADDDEGVGAVFECTLVDIGDIDREVFNITGFNAFL